MELELLLATLSPAAAALLTVIILGFKAFAEMRALKNEVKDSSTIKTILADNKRLNAMHRQTLEEMQDLREEISALTLSNQELTAAINRQNREA